MVAVYDDKWALLFQAMGDVEIKRASNVEYDHDSKEWVATHCETGAVIARGMNRAEVIKQEVAWLEERL